jgi:hypothetical protein
VFNVANFPEVLPLLANIIIKRGGKMKRIVSLASALLLLVSVAVAAEPAAKPAAPATKPVAAPAPAARPAAALTNADCAKCHVKAPADVEAKGMAHKTKVTCQDCHQGHPPTVKKIIPLCGQCHEGKPHYKLGGCLQCHKNPHQPKEIVFGRDVTDPCVSCHTPQIAQLKSSPSKHSKLACSFCHDVHGKIPQCTQCHKAHAADQVPGDCKKCHKAHMPKAVTYAADMPSKQCAACHAKAFTLLTASKAKHKSLLCVTCHQDKHKMVPKCQDCHGVPHAAGMMSKFPKCSDCHGIAHDLNNFKSAPGAAPAAVPAAATKKPAAKKK